MPEDIASAARRVASELRRGDGIVNVNDLRTLLPILEAVAAGQDDEERMERVARAMCVADQIDPDGRTGGYMGLPSTAMWQTREEAARAAMALADAERAARVAEGWKAYEEARETFGSAFHLNADASQMGWLKEEDEVELANDRTALDAAVRRLAGVA